MIQPLQKTIIFFSDREYFKLLVRFALPIALQNFVTSSLNMVAVIFIGQLGAVSVAAVGLANQIWFLLNLVLFGIVSGAAMFVAQLWGKRDVPNIRRVLGLTIKLGLVAAIIFWVIAVFFPANALKIYTTDPNVVLIGSRYLRIFGWSFGFFAITSTYSVASRSTGNVRLPLIVSTSALGLNIFLAYPLIFGIKAIGLPAFGIEGAAIAGLIARILECLTLVIVVYRNPTSPIAASLRNILEIDLRFMKAILKPMLPVIANEMLWSFGITAYNVIYGHIGTNAIAAINIVSTIEQMAFVVFLGLGTATAIMVGNLIGQGKKEKAFIYGGRSLALQAAGALMMGILVYFIGGNLFQFLKVAPEVIANAKGILTVFSLCLWIKASNHAIIVGILRSGGDTRFSLILDGLVIWFVGVPITAIGAFIFGLPVYFVYALTLSEEVTKLSFGLWRFFSKKWINDLTHKVAKLDIP
ncbi:MAG: MATE family efflux transporter [Chloroflexi bacterium]|nr:MATE family efflux transporter [Chloroflexota bacterium]